IGFRVLVSRHPAIQTTGLLTFAPAGQSPAEHASLRWTHNRTCGSPHPALGQDLTPSSTRRRACLAEGPQGQSASRPYNGRTSAISATPASWSARTVNGTTHGS